MAKLKKPLRMCIVCRDRLYKEHLLRLKNDDKKLVLYNDYGRSFYICKECINKTLEAETKKVEKALFREFKNKDEYIVQLKEILTHVR